MKPEDLKERTTNLAVSIIKLVDGLDKNTSISVFSKQMVRSSTSIGANYRAACGARYKA